MRLSIVIPNYNYADYVGKAIESALAVDWPEVEVIAVDDGSTDGSAEVIRSFGNRIQAVYQQNATQRVACNVGYSMSTGEAVMFLDSDDMVDPSIMQEVARVWRPGLSKVQVQMMRVNSEGRPMNSVFPAFNPMPTPEKITAWFRETSAYPTPPGSGNIYARSFLDKLFPLDDSCGSFSDSACLAAAPLLGDVETIPKPLVSYRVHGRNDSSLTKDPSRFVREILRAHARCSYAFRQTGDLDTDCELLLLKSLEVLQFRVAARRLEPDAQPLKRDSWLRLLSDCVRLPWLFPAATRKARLIVGVWGLLTLLTPRTIAGKLIALRYNRG
jgi:glycosyltransferase involved in cell wall biosynthesis